MVFLHEMLHILTLFNWQEIACIKEEHEDAKYICKHQEKIIYPYLCINIEIKCQTSVTLL